MTKHKDQSVEPLAIVGIGCMFPKAGNVKEFWSNIKEGVDAITEIPATHWKPSDYFDEDKASPDMTYAKTGGFIDSIDFDPLYYGMSPNNIEATDTTQLLGMVATREALLDAGYATGHDSKDGKQFDRDRTSVIMGVTGTLELVIPLGARLGHPIWRQALKDAGVDEATTEEVVERIAEGYVPWQENSFPGLLGNVAAGRIANRFDLGGTNCVVDAACASSLSAIHMAAMELYAGRADMAITGGLDTFNDIFMYMCFSKTPALSPTGNSRPFQADGDGTILGEGMGSIILKRLSDAEKDGDKIYALIKGIGSSSDGKGNAIYAPSPEGQQKALKNAYSVADIQPRTIELVEAHGTGTKVGDAVEAKALSAVYREDQAESSWCAIGSVKSMIGHTKAAAGVAGLIKIAMALRYKVLPPTIKVDNPLDILNPGDAPVYVNTVKRPWVKHHQHPRRAAVSAFGFGGSNFHAVLEESADPQSIDWDGRVLLLAYSGESIVELQSKTEALDTDSTWQELRKIAAQSLQDFDAKDEYRLIMVVEKDRSILKSLIKNVQHKFQEQSAEDFWISPDGAFFGRGEIKGKLAFLFPGQGAQYPGMLRDLACQFPQVLDALGLANDGVDTTKESKRLSDYIYPIPVFSKEAENDLTLELRNTAIAQPAIGALSQGSINILHHFSVRADGCAGHSYGELSALRYAGAYNEESFYRLSAKRGQLMQDGEGDRGSMLAVLAEQEKVFKIIEEYKLDLVIANLNAPSQLVLSGASEEISRAGEIFKKQKISCRQLTVAAAFHSSFVASAEKPLADFINSLAFSAPDIPVYSNTNATPYPESTPECQALLAGQLAQPVEFVSLIRNMYADGYQTFIEIGPSNILTGLVKSILSEQEHHAIALDSSKGNRQGQYDLACLLAQIAALGHGCDIGQWDAGYLDSLPEQTKPGMTIAVNGANYINSRDKRPPSPARQLPASITPSQPNRAEEANSTTLHVDNALLKSTQQSILALQQIQEQTADLHKQYLQGQEQAQQTINQLIHQQQQLLSGQAITGSQDILATAQRATHEIQKIADPVVEQKTESTKIVATKPTTETPNYHNILLSVVAEKTGYPEEMLSMEMSLDTDLGIDSIKRVEILSALQEKLPSMKQIPAEELGTFQLLQHIVEFMAQADPVDSLTSSTDIDTASSSIQNEQVQSCLLDVVADKTGYPVDMLNLDMNLDSDLGIDSIKRVEILSALQEQMPEMPAVSPDDLGTLHTLGQIIEFIAGDLPQSSTAPVATATSVSALQDILLDVVADKTGYPVDMLNLDMNLDSDLGIDSIKRVEILSALQERMPEMPAVSPDDLGTLHTLGQIIEFIAGDLPQPSTAPVATATAVSALQDILLDVVADKTGYPVDMLNLEMNLDSDLGIDSIKRVEILSALQERMPEMPAVSPDDLGTLQTLGQIISHIHGTTGIAPDAEETPAPQHVNVPSTTQKLYRGIVRPYELTNQNRHSVKLEENSVVWVTDDGTALSEKVCKALHKRKLDAQVVQLDKKLENDLKGLLVLVPENANSQFVLNAFKQIQTSGNQIERLACVTRFGGKFGIDEITATNPTAAALPGIIKTAELEWDDVTCKAIDVPAQDNNQKLADAIVDEFLCHGPVEVGIQNNKRFGLQLVESDLKQETTDIFNSNDLIVVTGGARGITAEICNQIAKAWQPGLLLLGRSPLPAGEPDWLKDLEIESEIKKAIISQKAADQQLTPKLVEDEYQKVIINREISKNLDLIRQAGSKVFYESVDIRNQETIAQTLDKYRQDYGQVSGIVHGAGILADSLIESKTEDQFSRVLNTKIDGFQNLLAATENDQLKAVVLFSSSTARFGRKGQVDYAAANEILNKSAQQLSKRHENCKVLSINWGPWDGGMVTPQLKELFAKEGVSVIPLQSGSEYLISELSNPQKDVEIVILGSRPEQNSPEEPEVNVTDTEFTLVFDRKVNTEAYPVLKSHVMNGNAVIPAALILEWLAHGAMHNNPGTEFIGFNDFRVLKGIILSGQESMDLEIYAGNLQLQGQEEKVIVELRSGTTRHARAEVILGHSYPAVESSPPPEVASEYKFENQAYYKDGKLFHGKMLQGIESVHACAKNGISATVKTAPAPSNWISQHNRSSWLADPLALDSAFQLMILWSTYHSGNGSLPTSFKTYKQYLRNIKHGTINVTATINKVTEYAINADIIFMNMNNEIIASIQGYECVVDASLKSAFEKNVLSSTESIN